MAVAALVVVAVIVGGILWLTSRPTSTTVSAAAPIPMDTFVGTVCSRIEPSTARLAAAVRALNEADRRRNDPSTIVAALASFSDVAAGVYAEMADAFRTSGTPDVPDGSALVTTTADQLDAGAAAFRRLATEARAADTSSPGAALRALERLGESFGQATASSPFEEGGVLQQAFEANAACQRIERQLDLAG